MSKLVEIKTKETANSAEDYIKNIEDDNKRKDSFTLLEMMKELSGEEPKIWGDSIIGFGKKIYQSPKTGRAVEWFKIGFSPRKSKFSLYLTLDINKYSEIMKSLGKYKTGVGCLYINKLADVDINQLRKLIELIIKEND